MQSIVIQASNIKCEGCVNTIKNGLQDLAGLATINVDIPSNQVTVEGDAPDKDLIEKKLAELGYPVV